MNKYNRALSLFDALWVHIRQRHKDNPIYR